MAGPTYRLLEDHWIGQDYLLASTTVSEDDVLPHNWIPTPNVDPLNTSAVNAFYAQGPRFPGLIRTQFSFFSVQLPITYWKQISPNFYALTGLGSNQSIYPPLHGV